LKTKKHYWRDLLFGYPHLLGTLGTTFSPLVNPALTSSLGRAMTGGVLGLTSDSSLPRYAAQSFQRWSRGIESSGGHRVVFFVGCYTNFNAPEIGKALVALLKLLDIDAVVPEQVCCGVPLISNGFKDRAISLFKQNLKTLLPYVREGCEVVCTCPTCGLALKEVYPEEMGTADALRLAGATYDYAEYLQLHAESLAAHFHPLRLRLAYHQPCHALAQGMGMPSLSLLSLIPEISAQLVEGCCGLSGTFGFKKEKGETSQAIGQPLFEAVSSINPDTVVTDCGTCAIQFVSRGGMKARHPLMVLKEAASAG
jgi:glycerol-3-phosphate dehydrogenase subunit C